MVILTKLVIGRYVAIPAAIPAKVPARREPKPRGTNGK